MESFTPNDVLFVTAETEGRHFSPETVRMDGVTRYRKDTGDGETVAETAKYRGNPEQDKRGIVETRDAPTLPTPSLYDWMLRKPIRGFYWRGECREENRGSELVRTREGQEEMVSVEEFTRGLFEIARKGVATRKK